MRLVLVAVALIVSLVGCSRAGSDTVQGTKLDGFPSLPPGLTVAQTQLMKALSQEVDSPGPGTKYAEGVEESWCADFVSWVRRAAGMPLANPNSGSWRIPGVYTLTEYFQEQGQFQGPGYQPKTGDVVLYSDSSPFGQHTNFVVRNDAGMLTTAGGNERNHVAVHRFDPTQDPGIVGFGVL